MKSQIIVLTLIGLCFVFPFNSYAQDSEQEANRRPEAVLNVGTDYSGFRMNEKKGGGSEYTYTFQGIGVHYDGQYFMNDKVLLGGGAVGGLLLSAAYDQTVSGVSESGTWDLSLYNAYHALIHFDFDYLALEDGPFQLSLGSSLGAQFLIIGAKEDDSESDPISLSEFYFPISADLKVKYWFNDTFAVHSSLSPSYSLYFMKSYRTRNSDLSALSWRFNIGLTIARYQ
ncbi:MAG: hypothetical protein ACOC0D_08285 [Spirochaeta sp.]